MRNFHAYCLVWLYWSYAHEAGFATISQKCLRKHCVVIESGHMCLNLDYLTYILPWSSYFYLLKTEFACMHAQLLQPCLPLCDPMDCSLTGFFVYGILQGKNTGVGCHALLQGRLSLLMYKYCGYKRTLFRGLC